MSAKNRGSKVIQNEHYATPPWLADAIMPYIRERLGLPPIRTATDLLIKVLEPCVGSGNILRSVQQHIYADITTFDIDPQWVESPQDFLAIPPKSEFDVIILNPPYSLAQEFVERAKLWRKNENSLIFVMLRVNFIGGQKRAQWLRDNPFSLYTTPKRPKMKLNKKGKLGSDATEYSWWEFSKHPTRIVILPTENIKDSPMDEMSKEEQEAKDNRELRRKEESERRLWVRE